jgi:hypothetical protein
MWNDGIFWGSGVEPLSTPAHRIAILLLSQHWPEGIRWRHRRCQTAGRQASHGIRPAWTGHERPVRAQRPPLRPRNSRHESAHVSSRHFRGLSPRSGPRALRSRGYRSSIGQAFGPVRFSVPSSALRAPDDPPPKTYLLRPDRRSGSLFRRSISTVIQPGAGPATRN